MKKLLSTMFLSLTLAACDTPPDVDFREGINAEFPTIEYVGKILGNCVTIDRPVTVTLVEADIYDDKTQSFIITLESVARVEDVECIKAVLEGNQ